MFAHVDLRHRCSSSLAYDAGMTQAIWNGTTIADSDDVLLVEFAVYFPVASVAPGVLRDSATAQTYCHWKGEASYYDVVVDGEVNEGAAWGYRDPYEDVPMFRERVAFWKGVEVVDKPHGAPMKDPGGPVGERTGYQALCWLLVRSEETSLSAAQIDSAIDLGDTTLASAFEHPRVRPFAQHYKWSLVDGVLRKG